MITQYLRTKFNGNLVGEDKYGTKYYEERRLLFKRSSCFGQERRKRRWAIYKNDIDASYIPAEWHGWLHYTKDTPPTSEPLTKPHSWQKDHRPNLTGTPLAYRPKGSLLTSGKVDKEYQAWTPHAE